MKAHVSCLLFYYILIFKPPLEHESFIAAMILFNGRLPGKYPFAENVYFLFKDRLNNI